MDDIREIKRTRQIPGEPQRRWFTSSEFDLYVWCNESGDVTAFQLCYDKSRSERALTWKRDTGFSHLSLDDGEGRAFRHKATPILVAGGRFEVNRLLDRFTEASGQLPRRIVEFVLARLREHPDCDSQ